MQNVAARLGRELKLEIDPRRLVNHIINSVHTGQLFHPALGLLGFGSLGFKPFDKPLCLPNFSLLILKSPFLNLIPKGFFF